MMIYVQLTEPASLYIRFPSRNTSNVGSVVTSSCLTAERSTDSVSSLLYLLSCYINKTSFYCSNSDRLLSWLSAIAATGTAPGLLVIIVFTFLLNGLSGQQAVYLHVLQVVCKSQYIYRIIAHTTVAPSLRCSRNNKQSYEMPSKIYWR